MSITAIIVARGGSVRLPNKALLPFAGVTMIGHKVRTLRACKSIDRVVVGSDSLAILEEAADYGAETIRRDDYHCDESKCSANEMIADMAEKVGGSLDDLIVWAHPTNPCVRSETYEAAIDAFQQSAQHDSLCSVYAVQRHAWMVDRPLNYDPWKASHTLAKDCRPILFQDGAIFIQPRGQMLANRYFFGRRPLLFVMPDGESADVDTRSDYEAALSSAT